MLTFFDRFVGALTGILSGSLYCLGLLGLVALNTLGAAYLLLRSTALTLRAYGEVLFNYYAQTLKKGSSGLLSFVFALVDCAFVTPFMLLSAAIDITISATTIAWDTLKTIGAGVFIALLQPLIGFSKGLRHGIKRSILYIRDLFSPYPQEQSTGLSGSIQKFVFYTRNTFRKVFNPPQRRHNNIHLHPQNNPMQDFALLNQGINRLPANQRQAFSTPSQNSNRDLAEKIRALVPSPTPQALKLDAATIAQIKNSNHPNKSRLLAYAKINEDNLCSISQDNLLELTQPLTVEYQDDNSHWHSKVFNTQSLLPWINQASNSRDVYASLPEGRIPLTAENRYWIPATENGQTLLKSSDGKMKIYAGINPRLIEELRPLVAELRQLAAAISANPQGFFARGGVGSANGSPAARSPSPAPQL